MKTISTRPFNAPLICPSIIANKNLWIVCNCVPSPHYNRILIECWQRIKFNVSSSINKCRITKFVVCSIIQRIHFARICSMMQNSIYNYWCANCCIPSIKIVSFKPVTPAFKKAKSYTSA